MPDQVRHDENDIIRYFDNALSIRLHVIPTSHLHTVHSHRPLRSATHPPRSTHGSQLRRRNNVGVTPRSRSGLGPKDRSGPKSTRSVSVCGGVAAGQWGGGKASCPGIAIRGRAVKTMTRLPPFSHKDTHPLISKKITANGKFESSFNIR